jgi:hypothetical protein
LLHGDGTNGAQNNTFIDSSTNNFTITRNGNTTQGTFTPFSKPDGQWGNHFDGSGDTLTLPTGQTPLFLSNSDFTIEAWVYRTSGTSAAAIMFGQTDLATNAGSSWAFRIGSSANSEVSIGSTPYTVTAANPTLNSWSHVAFVRTGGTLSTYLNGSRVGTRSDLSTSSVNNGNTNYAPSIGGISSFELLTGYISNLRILKGSGGYDATSSTITVPTAPLTAITNTSLLTCQSNRFIDNSSNNFAITRNGDVRVTPFSPFPITTAYSTSVNGGAGYFDGTGDFLTWPSSASVNFGTGDFTVECFIYPAASLSGKYLIDARDSGNTGTWALGFGLSTGDSKFGFFDGTSTIEQASASVVLNSWQHCVVVRSGSTLSLYLSGSRVATATNTKNINVSPTTSYIGNRYTGSGYEFPGYMASARIVKGTAVYDPTQTTLTVPTAPLTAISGTSLLTNFTNAGIFDNTGFNALETVGDAQIDTTTKKYGTGSMEFDGTGDYLIMNGGENFAFGTGDFTIEFWYYSNNTGSQQILYDARPASSNGNYVTFYKSSSNVLELYVNNSVRATGSTSIAASTWYHVALCRSGTSTKMFLNGTQEGSTYTDSTNYLNGANRPVIGADSSTLGNLPVNGYIDDLRITKGIARYTTTFTPPTAALPDIGA